MTQALGVKNNRSPFFTKKRKGSILSEEFGNFAAGLPAAEHTFRERKGQEMEAYTSFAAVYDRFMDNVPYEEWTEYLWGLLTEYGVKDGLVLDLGCGTGNLTEALAGRGYDMIGVDNSEDMLQIAIEKRTESGADILYLLQDMQAFELYGTVAAAVSICDSMNYLTAYQEFVSTLSLVNNYLDPGGIFIFDMNTLYKYRDVIGDRTIAENREDCSFIWENVFDEEERINEYDLTLFIEEGNGLYRRFEETHYQKAYTLEEIRQAVAESGMKLEAMYDAFTREEPKKDSERVYVVVRECGKSTLPAGQENG